MIFPVSVSSPKFDKRPEVDQPVVQLDLVRANKSFKYEFMSVEDILHLFLVLPSAQSHWLAQLYLRSYWSDHLSLTLLSGSFQCTARSFRSFSVPVSESRMAGRLLLRTCTATLQLRSHVAARCSQRAMSTLKGKTITD